MSVWATRDGKNFYTDSEGGAWRVLPLCRGHGLPPEGGDP